MKFIFSLLLFSGFFPATNAQLGSLLHEGKFKKTKVLMHSDQYKPDDWEKPYFDSAVRTAFPSDLIKFPGKYKGKIIHLLGIVDSVYRDSASVTFVLENKYWDYIEDYSIQDEVMFVSPMGDGKFLVTLPAVTDDEFERMKKFPVDKKFFLVYGTPGETINNLPVIAAQQIKYIPYELYTTTVFTYEVKRDANGNVEADKKGKPGLANFHFLKVAKAGQNK